MNKKKSIISVVLAKDISFSYAAFFVLSGYVYKGNTGFEVPYIKKCVSRYLLPYIAYAIFVLVVLDRNFFRIWFIWLMADV